MTPLDCPPFRADDETPPPAPAPEQPVQQAILGLEAQVNAAIAQQTAEMQSQLAAIMQEAGKVSALPFRVGS